MTGCAGALGKLALLRHGAESLERLPHVGFRRVRGEFHRDRLGVAVDHRHAIAVGADLGGQRLDVVAREIAQDLLRLLLHLLFFAADEGDHVAHDVHRRHAGIARAGDGLHRGDDHFRDAELLERSESHRRGRWWSSSGW